MTPELPSEEMERRGSEQHDKVTDLLSDMGFVNFSVHSPSQHTLIVTVLTEDDISGFIDNLQGIVDTLRAEGVIF